MQNGGIQSNVKSIQRGVIVLGAINTNTATVAQVNIAKSELRFLGCLTSETGANNVSTANVVLTNSTTITAQRNTNAGGSVNVSWELTEFN